MLLRNLTILIAIIGLSLTYLPNFWWHVVILADYFLPWKSFTSPMIHAYHSFLISRLPDQPERPALELPLAEASFETLSAMSKGFTVPVIIRGALKDAPALTQWLDKNWWLKNYGDESVLCKYVEKISDSDPACTVKESFGSLSNSNGTRLYISGESKLFVKRPELNDMVKSDFIDSLAPGPRVFTQIFMGFSGMGSDVHSAMGCNIFRQIAGRKKWWLIPQSQTAFVFSSLNQNGFSAHTLTKVGKGTEDPSPWLNKLERYTVTLEPGDILLNTPWYWHGIVNLPGDHPDDLVIGVPTRYSVKYALPAFKSNWLLSAVAMAAISKQFGGIAQFISNPNNLQDGIERARKARAETFNERNED